MPQDNNYFSSGVRESMLVLPQSVQKLLTLITGKAVSGQKRVKIPAIMEFTLTLLILLASTLGAMWLLSHSPYILWLLILLPCWVSTVGCLRKIQVTYAHHAVHQCLFNSNKNLNRIMLAICTIIPIVQNGRDYTNDHLGHHNKEIFTTESDSDAFFLKSLGFLPGLSLRDYKIRLTWTIINPIFHLHFFWLRVTSFAFRGSRVESLFAILWAIMIIAPVFFNPLLAVLCIYIPYFVIYHISALLQFLTEHAWLLTKHAPKNIEDYARRCWGRFTGDIYPVERNSLVKLAWWLRMLFFHSPCRVMILCGDLPVHDWHHLAGELGQSSLFWQDGIYLRQQAVSEKSNDIFLQETWGIHNMIMNSFVSLSKAEINDVSEQ